MDVDEIQCKFPRLSNGNGRILDPSSKMTQKTMDGQYPDEEEDGGGGEHKRVGGTRGGSGTIDLSGGVGRFYGWPSSRIVRVSRASGGKDRHSKVLTSKGLRDRRVRLSVNTAIQFYDLQDRLGYDQPSKAVEWLLKAAANSIAELPPMNSPFPDTPKQLSDEKRSSTGGSDQLGFDSAEVDMDGGGGGGDVNYQNQQQHVTKSSAACSSTSETSKGSGLSLSRSESRIKARERAKERVLEKEKEKESETSHHAVAAAALNNPISHTTSFTELLSGGLNNVHNSPNHQPQTNGGGGGGANESNLNFFQSKSPRQWSSTAMDYLTSGLLGPAVSRAAAQMNPMAVASPLFSVAGDHHHPELPAPHFSFVPDNHHHHHHHLHNLVSVVGGNSNNNSSNNNNNNNGSNNEYNLNFTISSNAANNNNASSGLAGFNRGTLQSNSSSPSLMSHLQRFPTLDGSSPHSFFTGAATPQVESHHQFLSGFDGRGLQLCYGDAAHANNNGRHSGHKGKGKN